MKSGIYCYTNKINNKKYIGQAQDLSKRIYRHERNFRCSVWEKTSPRENKPLWQAVRKYGINCIELEILEYCSIDDLDEREMYYIRHLGSHFSSNGYNLSFGGNTARGTIHTKESRNNMSKSHLGKKFSLETKIKMKKAYTGKKREFRKSKYFGVFPQISKNKNKTYWVVDVREYRVRVINKLFKDEICAAVFYDNEVIRLELSRPLNFSEIERQEIMNSVIWSTYGK